MIKTAKRKKLNKGVRDVTLDALVREYVKAMSAGYCKRCKKHVGIVNLEAAHIIPRKHKTVRWDLRNVFPLCLDCHDTIDRDCFAKTEFSYTVLTREEIAEVQRLGNMTLKTYPIDREQVKAELKVKIRKLE
jgi:predicted restriction endonuclease